MLNLTSLGAASQGNYTCAGVNYLGVGESASVFLEITGEEKKTSHFLFVQFPLPAPPHLIDGPSEFTGVVLGEEASITCHVECSPLCGIQWLVDGELLDQAAEEDEGGSGDWQLSIGQYTVEVEEVEEDEDHFSSVLSTLAWEQLLNIDSNITIACRWQTYFLNRMYVHLTGCMVTTWTQWAWNLLAWRTSSSLTWTILTALTQSLPSPLS